MTNIPEVLLKSSSDGRKIPVIGFGTAADGFDTTATKLAVVEAIKLGFRHFDTAAIYGSEKALGEAIAEALKARLIKSRDELFVTSKLWCSDAHGDLVIPALRKSLKNLGFEYLDLYLIHWPISAKPGEFQYPIPPEEFLPMDFKAVWTSMEECQRLGLTKSIGVSNFSSKKLQTILSFATIPPSVNQVEMNPTWQQKKLIEFSKENGIIVTAFSPLGAAGTSWGGNLVMGNECLKQIANFHGKSVAQVSLRWIYEQGATMVVKSYNKQRLQENLGIFDWQLTEDDYDKIKEIPQKRNHRDEIVSAIGPYKTVEELWDGEI